MEIKEYVRKIMQMTQYRAYNNCGFVSQCLMNFMQNNKISFVDFENEFRSQGSRIYLVASPLDPRIISQGFSSFLPGSEQKFQYWLWVGMNPADTAKQLRDLNITKTENLERLSKTGFLNFDPYFENKR